MPRLATLKASLDFLLLGRLERLFWLLHLVLLDCLTKALVFSTKGLMNHHFSKLLIALSVLFPTLHQLGIIYLELLILPHKVSLKNRYVIARKEQGMSSKSWHEVEASTFATLEIQSLEDGVLRGN